VEKFSTHIDCSPEETVFFKPFAAIQAEAVPQQERERLSKDALAAIRDHVQPGMKSIREYIAAEYLHHTRENIAASSLPDGENFYKRCIRFHTSSALSAQEIHDLGLQEVDRIEGEMKKVRR